MSTATSPFQPEARPSAELRVTAQLVEAMLFEGLLPYRKSADGICDHATLEIRLGQTTYRINACIGGFDRIHLDRDSLSISGITIDILLKQLSANAIAIRQLANELQQTITLSEWNCHHLPARLSRRYLSFNDLEQHLDEGHPYHPCFRARSGFSLTDHQQFGPECGQPFQVRWLAIRRDCLKSNLPVEEKRFWQAEIGLDDWQLLVGRLVLLSGDLTQYGLIPIHPWQWKQLQSDALAPLIENRQLLYLGAVGPRYRASQSVRTLIPVEPNSGAHLKLPLDMVNTSSRRTLEPHAVCTAPIISDWLHTLVNNDPYLSRQQPLVILREYAGLLLTSEQPKLQGQVAAIWRENILQQLAADEAAVPFTALLVTEQDGQPFIAHWVQQFGLRRWLTQLFKTSVLPIWHLLIHHGIAIEAHAQNLILLHQNGWPSRIAARDFHESLEYVDDFLLSHEEKPDFSTLDDCYQQAPNNQYYWMEEVEALRELFVDTLFIYNLAELANLLQQYYDFSETLFWQLLHTEIRHYHLAQKIDETRLKRLDLQQQLIATESLLTRKLHVPPTTESHHLVNNPFYSLENNNRVCNS